MNNKTPQTLEFSEVWDTLESLSYNESYTTFNMSRNEIIKELVERGVPNYNFEYKTDKELKAWLYKLRRSQKNSKKLDLNEPESQETTKIEHTVDDVCEKCGRLLTYNKECPLCDLNDESVLDEE